jgi:hypothetical protein
MSLIDPSLLNSLSFLFGQTMTVQRKTISRSPSGGEVNTWADLKDHVNIPCVISSKSKVDGSPQKIQRKDGSYVYELYKVMLKGYYPSITHEDQVVSDGKTYEILSIVSDSEKVMTTLQCAIIS